MEIYIDKDSGDYAIVEPVGNQTMEMRFERFHETIDSIYYWVILSIADKRNRTTKVFEKRQTTGTNPHASVCSIREAYEVLEEAIVADHVRNVVICVGWEDGKRRNVYWRYLSRKGYRMGTIFKSKCIYKKFKGE